MQPNQTLQQTADNLGVPVETLMAFFQAASRVIQDAERHQNVPVNCVLATDN